LLLCVDTLVILAYVRVKAIISGWRTKHVLQRFTKL
jgi:hypothetical protein